MRILVIGAGQIGSRHIQGLVGAESQLEVTVVDPCVRSLETAKRRWVEAGGMYSNHKIHWTYDIAVDLEKVDLALIATSAKGRAELVGKVASQISVRFWVFEKVLAQSVWEIDLITRATSQSQGVWVNTPRRMMGAHNFLKKCLEGKGPVNVFFSGDLWGLACNSIHFIDLVAWWMDEELRSVELSSLNAGWFESKRPRYFEVTGTLVAHFSGGSTLALASRDQAEIQPLRIDLADGTSWKMDEVNGSAFSTAGDHIEGGLDFQSQLSGRLVDDILCQGQCDLPTLKQSASMHAIFLKAMLEHWNLSQKRNDTCVPIT